MPGMPFFLRGAIGFFGATVALLFAFAIAMLPSPRFRSRAAARAANRR